jgi:hypothetical protein
MLWTSSRPDPDVAEKGGPTEGGRPELTRQSWAGQAPSGTSFRRRRRAAYLGANISSMLLLLSKSIGATTTKATAGNRKAVWRTERRGEVIDS